MAQYLNDELQAELERRLDLEEHGNMPMPMTTGDWVLPIATSAAITLIFVMAAIGLF